MHRFLTYTALAIGLLAVASTRFATIGTDIIGPGYTLPKLLWIKEHQPELYDRADHFLLWSDLVAFMLGCEPFRHRGPYDFGASTISGRAREIGFDLTLRKGFRSLPPPAVLFLHRKLGGTFLLCARLGARVNTRKLLSPFLQG